MAPSKKKQLREALETYKAEIENNTRYKADELVELLHEKDILVAFSKFNFGTDESYTRGKDSPSLQNFGQNLLQAVEQGDEAMVKNLSEIAKYATDEELGHCYWVEALVFGVGSDGVYPRKAVAQLYLEYPKQKWMMTMEYDNNTPAEMATETIVNAYLMGLKRYVNDPVKYKTQYEKIQHSFTKHLLENEEDNSSESHIETCVKNHWTLPDKIQFLQLCNQGIAQGLEIKVPMFSSNELLALPPTKIAPLKHIFTLEELSKTLGSNKKKTSASKIPWTSSDIELYCRIFSPEKFIPWIILQSIAHDEKTPKSKQHISPRIATDCVGMYPEITDKESSLTQSLIRYAASKEKEDTKIRDALANYIDKPIVNPKVSLAIALNAFDTIDPFAPEIDNTLHAIDHLEI